MAHLARGLSRKFPPFSSARVPSRRGIVIADNSASRFASFSVLCPELNFSGNLTHCKLKSQLLTIQGETLHLFFAGRLETEENDSVAVTRPYLRSFAFMRG